MASLPERPLRCAKTQGLTDASTCLDKINQLLDLHFDEHRYLEQCRRKAELN